MPERIHGLTGYCSGGRHQRCPYRPGGPCHGGIALISGGRYDCPCECHSAPQFEPMQLEFFAESEAPL